MDAHDRTPILAPWLDLRAFKIEDPIERLQFLRDEMRALEAKERCRRPWRFNIRPLIWLTLAGFVGELPASRPDTVQGQFAAQSPTPATAQGAAPITSAVAEIPERVWMVDRSQNLETYSNGLHVDLTYTVSNKPRFRYPVYAVSGSTAPAWYATVPNGIVYHTTESHLAPFEEEQNGRLKQIGRNLLENIRQQKSYHYVIDRFGRVFRVVEESDSANHAGHSVWADSSGVYVNLNSSFLGVAFEAQTGEPITPAQVSSARVLTEMLRARYEIQASNCVTHAQVSVNPMNMKMGLHVDWASGFPFNAVGLPDNYSVPVPSLWAFGFEYDSTLVGLAGGRWKGLDVAEGRLASQATAEGLAPPRYRAVLQRRYREIVSALDILDRAQRPEQAVRSNPTQPGAREVN